MDILRDWIENLQSRTDIRVTKKSTASGEYFSHNGPSIKSAYVELEISPDNEPSVDISKLDNTNENIDPEIINSVVFGVMDVMLTSLSSPIKNYKLTINNLGYDEIQSTQIAFRMAARDAAQKILKTIY
jgi:hypothetical protein